MVNPGRRPVWPACDRGVDERVRQLVFRPRAPLDGTFLHQGPPEPATTATAVGLHWRLPAGLRDAAEEDLSNRQTPGVAPQLDAKGAQALILDGRGWSNKDRNSAYNKLSADQLMERLGSWSPVVRERAAMALGQRREVSIPPLLKMLESPH